MSLRNGQTTGSIRTWRRYFPLNSVDDVVNLMQEFIIECGIQPSPLPLHPPSALSNGDFKYDEPTSGESKGIHGQIPNLAFVSTILGYIENQLTLPSQDYFLSRKCRSISTAASRVSTSTSSQACHKTLIPPSPLSIQTDIEHSIHAGTSSSDPSPMSTVSSTATTPVQQPLSRKTKRLHRFSGSSSSGGSRSRRLRHTSASNFCPISVDTVGDLTPISTTVYSGDGGGTTITTTKRRRFSETSLPTSHVSHKTDTFPRLTFDDVEQYYREFHNLIVTSPLLLPYAIDPLSTPPRRWVNRDLIRSVLQVLWNRMAGAGRGGRDRQTHTQSVYSFLTTGLLDSFGLAYTTVAACQLLGYSDVDLALSEDHGWVEFGPPEDRQTADVASWVHQRQQQQQLQQQQMLHQPHHQLLQHQSDQQFLPSIREPPLFNSWLYVNGQPVLCRPRLVAMAAAVTAMQPGGHHDLLGPSLSSSATSPLHLVSTPSTPSVSYQLVQLKHRLLWLLYSSGCLSRYPLGLTNLADLEDSLPVIDAGRHPMSGWPLALYRQAVAVSRVCYNNQHVYPYTCLAGCLYRQKNYPEALYNWSQAARVIGQYKHSSEDLEVYRELLEIATHWMPQLFRSAAEARRSCSQGLEQVDPDGCIFQPDNVLDSPKCLAHLLSFYDHLCLWEESAPVPVLHVGWVDKLMVNLGRFSSRARRHLHLVTSEAAAVSMEATAAAAAACSRHRARTVCQVSPLVCSTSPAVAGFTKKPDVCVSTSSQVEDDGVSPKPDDGDQMMMTPGTLVEPLPLSSTTTTTTTGGGGVDPDEQKESPSGRQEVLLLEPEKGGSAVADTWHLLSNGTVPEEPSAARSTGGGGGEDPDASPSPPPLLLFPGDQQDQADLDQLEDEEDTEELLSSLAEACDRRLLNPAFLSGIEPNAPFLPADCQLDEAFDRLFAVWGAGAAVSGGTTATADHSCPPDSSSAAQPSRPHRRDDDGDGDDDDSASIFPTPPSSGGLTEATVHCPSTTVLLPQQQEDVEMPCSVIGRKETDVEDAEEDSVFPVAAGGLKMFQELLNSVPEDDSEVTEKQVTDTKVDEEEASKSQPPPLPPPREKRPADPAVHLTLRSTKMVSIVELLRAARLNSSAIKLALTAQSQVSLRRSSATSTPSPYAL